MILRVKHIVPNPKLTREQHQQLFAPLFARVKADLYTLSGGDARLMWALRRKLAKELVYIERGTPTARNKLKALMWSKQNGNCALCDSPMQQKNSELDRFEAYGGYFEDNVRLVHHECHIKDQARKGYA